MNRSEAEVDAKGLTTALKDLSALTASSADRKTLAALEAKVAALSKDGVVEAKIELRQGSSSLALNLRIDTIRLQRGICTIRASSKDSPLANEVAAIFEKVILPPKAEWDALWNQRRAEDAIISKALARVGIRAASVYWLVNDRVKYGPEAVDPLLSVLPSVHDDHLRGGIFRALGMREWPEATRVRINDAILPLLRQKEYSGCRSEIEFVLKETAPASRKQLVQKGIKGSPLRASESELPKSRPNAKGSSSSPKPLKGAAEVSANLDQHQLPETLRRISAKISSGFGSKEISEVLTMVRGMKLSEERSLDFEVAHQDKKCTLRISVFMDDEDAPDLVLRSDFAPLIRLIEKVLA